MNYKTTIYLLPGYGGSLQSGLGEGLLSRGWSVAGRETQSEFRRLPFQEQIDLIASDLQDSFWHSDARLIANSYGGYLFLHAQAQMPPFPGWALLLSPIVGDFANESTMLGFVPPRSGKLFELVQAGQMPAPQNCTIHVGSEDWQSNPKSVALLAERLGIQVTVVPNTGHELGKAYVGALLDSWLPN